MDIAGWQAQNEQLTRQVLALRSALADIRTTAHSPDGFVTAVAGGRGELLDLELDPRVFRNADAAALAATIRDTVQAAATQAEREAARFAVRLLPERDQASVDPAFDPVLRILEG